MNNFSTKTLLNLLICLLEMQVIGLRLKYQSRSKIRVSVYLPKGWKFKKGICYNLTTLFNHQLVTDWEESVNQSSCLTTLFSNCPSFSGFFTFPVPAVYPSTAYVDATPQMMWGNHQYADSRRKILQECIDQLYKELGERGYQLLN